MENKTIICLDCGQEFELTEGWKKLMAEHTEIQEPKRCYSCRQAKKQEKERENNKGIKKYW